MADDRQIVVANRRLASKSKYSTMDMSLSLSPFTFRRTRIELQGSSQPIQMGDMLNIISVGLISFQVVEKVKGRVENWGR